MYNEIEIIDNLQSKKDKIEIIMLYIEEYSGWLQHVKSAGLTWGANGEECKANKEAVKTRKHIDLLKNKLLEISCVH
jgi:hypothetical protein